MCACVCVRLVFCTHEKNEHWRCFVAVTQSTSSRDFDFNLVGQLLARASFLLPFHPPLHSTPLPFNFVYKERRIVMNTKSNSRVSETNAEHIKVDANFGNKIIPKHTHAHRETALTMLEFSGHIGCFSFFLIETDFFRNRINENDLCHFIKFPVENHKIELNMKTKILLCPQIPIKRNVAMSYVPS